MNNFYRFLVPLFFLLQLVSSQAQTLTCNSAVSVALNDQCTHTLLPDQVLEGTVYNDCVVQLDRTPPFGNGPWQEGILGPADVGQAFIFRVVHIPSGNMCWGQIEARDLLPPVLDCTPLTTIDLLDSDTRTIGPSDLSVNLSDACLGNVTTFFEGNQPTLTLDCSDLGPQVITLTVKDAAGNSATCQATLLVTNSTGECGACVQTCPLPQTVSFELGYDTLLPAFNAGDLSVFEDFGNALLDPTCTFTDSTYNITYFPNNNGSSWFLRRWVWSDATGAEVGACEQAILFNGSRPLSISGRVYLDNFANCNYELQEPPLSLVSVRITAFPSGQTLAVQPDADGQYQATFNLGILDTAAQVRLELPAGLGNACPNSYWIPYTTDTLQQTFDFGVQSSGNCPSMEAHLGALSFRRCFTNIFYLKYCNTGLDTAVGAHLNLQLDPLMTLEGANWPYTLAPDGSFDFEVGTVAPLTCNTINLLIHIDCDATLGQTLCAEVNAFPNDSCIQYNGPNLEATATCAGDSVDLILHNRGGQPMDQTHNFIVIEDFIMFQGGAFQLDAGASMTVRTPANGATWRIETPQVENHPTPGLVAAMVEGCGGTINTPGVITAFGLTDQAGYQDIECQVVTGSFDPNDKSAVPTGFGDDHLIRVNEWIEYKIRFQNTGNDTAFRVLIVDTLSSHLNLMTLEAGASSHPYRLDVYSGGILHFIFEPIALPDSNVNEAGSHGFVQFRIQQQPNLHLGTVIENSAAIYFDQNDPIITNTVRHTIGQPYVVLDAPVVFQSGWSASILPNPCSDQAILHLKGATLQDGQCLLFDLNGNLCRLLPVNGQQVTIDRGTLPAGIYLYQLREQGRLILSGKLGMF